MATDLGYYGLTAKLVVRQPTSGRAAQRGHRG